MSALAANDVWSVGDFDQGYRHTLTEHWDGKSWQVVSSPDGQTILNQLTGVVALSASDVWAAGDIGTSQGTGKTLIEHWNGSQWSIVPSANPGQLSNVLDSITGVLQSQQLWTVGIYQTSSSDVGHTLTETNC